MTRDSGTYTCRDAMKIDKSAPLIDNIVSVPDYQIRKALVKPGLPGNVTISCQSRRPGHRG